MKSNAFLGGPVALGRATLSLSLEGQGIRSELRSERGFPVKTAPRREGVPVAKLPFGPCPAR